LFKRHFFLVAAVVLLAVMIIAGSLKVIGMKAGAGQAGGPGGPGVTAKGPGGGAGGMGKGGGRGFGGPAQVTPVSVTPRAFQDTIEVLGVAKGRQSVTLTAAATQLVERVRFSDGQRVPRGAILVELRDTEQDAGVSQAQARLVQAQRSYERYKTLGEQGYASKAAIDEREAAWRSAQADVAAARARESDRVIRAPFAGVVGLSDVAPGALVNPGAPIVTLDDISAIRVDFQVPERYLAQLREGQPILATVDAFPGETISGRIAKLDTRVDERTRAITARAEFANPQGRLKPGTLIRVGVSRGGRQSLSAPESAVSVQGDNAFVYVIRTMGERTMAEQRPIVTGIRQQGFVEILDGVRPGERIVGDGLNKIQPGQPVRIAGAAGPRGPGARGAAGGPNAAGARPSGPRPPA
jgi:membrane fusion protein (multidrug efflux system)